jgi:hypothetical protein
MPGMGRPVSPFVVEREGRLLRRERREKEGKKKEKKQKDEVVYDVILFFSPRAPLVVRVMETCIIPRSCSLLEQRASPVNPDKTPHPVTGVGGVN